MSATSQAQSTAPLPPTSLRLKPHVDSYRHVYQGRVWYVFHDRAAHRHYRISGEGAEFLGALDGRRGLDEILAALQARDPENAPDQEHVVQFIQQLHALDLLQTEVVPDVAKLDARRDALRRRRLISALRTPLSLKVKLLDPTRLLGVLLPWLGWIFSPVGMLLWLAVTAIGAGVGLTHWDELTRDVTDRLLSTENLLVAGAVYPVVKILHELGHGLALRRLGMEVRQIGVLFAAFIPVPYVDASASAVLERRSDRMMVGAAGILVEMFVGSLALMVWSQAEPGALRSVCYNIIVISGFSTLLFNGNPLQRYDGYYILTDLTGIPGLGMRSTQYLAGLFRRHVMGDAQALVPFVTPAERWWFLLYGPASFLYRLSLMLVISFYVAERYPGLGLILAAWSMLGYFASPMSGLATFLRTKRGPQARRGAAGLCALGVAVALLLFLVPAPRAVMAQGVVAMPDEAIVRPSVSGVFAEWLAQPGETVAAGQKIARLVEPAALSRLERAKARVAELHARLIEATATDAGRAAAIGEQLAQVRRDLDDAARDVAALDVRAPAAGVLLMIHPEDLPGRYVMHGEAFATVWNADRAVIRAAAAPADIADLRAILATHDSQRGRGIAIRPGWDAFAEMPARILRIVPAASDILPSTVLSLEGGGPFAVTRGSDNQPHTEEAVFEIDLRTEKDLPITFLNGRMNVRVALDPLPLGLQLWRQARLVFLRRLHA